MRNLLPAILTQQNTASSSVCVCVSVRVRARLFFLIEKMDFMLLLLSLLPPSLPFVWENSQFMYYWKYLSCGIQPERFIYVMFNVNGAEENMRD